MNWQKGGERRKPCKNYKRKGEIRKNTFHYVSLCLSSRSGFVIIKKGEIVESSLDFDDNKTIYVYLTCLLSMQRFSIHLINGSFLNTFQKKVSTPDYNVSTPWAQNSIWSNPLKSKKNSLIWIIDYINPRNDFTKRVNQLNAWIIKESIESILHVSVDTKSTSVDTKRQ